MTDTCPQPYKFTGKERDTESGLDFFIARYYSSGYGRFFSPDEFTGGPVDAFSSGDPLPPGALPYADATNPQSLNKYTYTYNNPLNLVDPDGHCPVVCPDRVAIEVTVRVVDLAKPAVRAANTAGSNLIKGIGIGLVVAWSLTMGAEPLGDGTLTGRNQTQTEDQTDGTEQEEQQEQQQEQEQEEQQEQKQKPTKKKKDEDVVTSSGQKADKDGRKLGPSGKPMVHQVDHKSKKEAKDAARSQGQTAPAQHRSPKKGSPHFHATDKDGKKKAGSTHHNYPK